MKNGKARRKRKKEQRAVGGGVEGTRDPKGVRVQVGEVFDLDLPDDHNNESSASKGPGWFAKGLGVMVLRDLIQEGVRSLLR